eukprot:Gregarina_sp_Poly_1__1765@NODE_1458_length_4095_cov_178_894985_g965_i0_p2_GENE_NODE_1458_length_4095_cov_178_894985_g965_i0NODE_1458_length_4095_cov_178_894985_g965_i0_p2_ORF_typecomplete_len300_score42_58Abhydrolase_6/PF12697_7/1_4e28Hydrolase_4/PF12146_8/1_9e18Abhydrolase_1/PF00561_20/6_5e12Thioesterase/PF00975_20/3_6e10DUF676/PF05057_14/4_2e08Chlorophyllase2/PF12740_7/3e08Abhydrolase_2/PF02230_16/9_2e07DUF1057/PF06342_12/3_6e06Abhydrolase_5/PF12695_7/9_2e06AXE1/PF05448_12/1_5e05PAFAH_p_II/PF0
MLPPKRPIQPRLTTLQSETNKAEWFDYFRDQDLLEAPNGDVFNCYFGGAWHCPSPGTPLIVFFHGAGHTGLSFALLSKQLEHAYITAAYDMRHHGLTRCEDSKQNLGIQLLVEDGIFVVNAIQAKVGSKQPLILCGHSMGGSVAARVAARLEPTHQIFAVVLLDIVEELALDALPNVSSFIRKYPTHFPTADAAIRWALHNILKNKESASLSIPSQLRWEESSQSWVWRVDLAASSDYWHEWFLGLSDCFLSLRATKILILAGTPHDKLDSKLTIAHMQGKFQLEILPKTGHIIQVRNE